MRRIAGVLGVVLGLLAGAAPLRADVVPSLLTGYTLTSWAQKDGITSPLIYTLDQDRLGYLWLGTDAGVLRFDGVRFVRWDDLAQIPAPGVSVRALRVSHDDAIWVGLGEPGGVGVLRDGALRMYGAAEGLPDGIVMALTQLPDGALLAGGRFGVFRFGDDRWVRWDEGLPPGLVNDLFVDQDGSTIASTGEGVFARPAGASAFTRLGRVVEQARSVARGHDGRLYVTDAIIGFREASVPRERVAAAQKARGSRLLRDTRGNLWVGTGGQGLWRIQHHGDGGLRLFERTSTVTGLSDDGVTEMLEDREGNIWIATRDGLNRLSPHRMTPLMDLGIVNAVEASDEWVWVGTADAIVPFAGGSLTSRAAPIAVPQPPLAAMHADRRGRLWVATASALFRLAGSRLEPVPMRGATLRDITEIVSDNEDGLWVHDGTSGLWRWRQGVLAPAPVPDDLRLLPLLASYADREGRSWFAYQNGGILSIDAGDRVRVHRAADGVDQGPYRVIHQDRTGALWFGGVRGLTRFKGGTFTAFPPLPGVSSVTSGLVDDEDGNLWVAIESAGLLRMSGHAIARALTDPSERPRASAYDKMDGSAGTSRWFGYRSAVRGPDGRLWFVAGRGVTVVDSDALDDEAVPEAPVRVERALVDGRRLSTDGFAVLPPRTTRLQVDYTVLNLTSPLRTRFRHRLDGFDGDWIDAGTARTASYTNLPPRDYRFRVMATTVDGSVADTVAEWSFRIEPMFYQTWWFAGLCVAAVGASVGISWRLHVRSVRQRFALLLGERARLSREVHDTLLQSMFGVALQVDALGEAVPPGAPELRARLAGLRHQVEEDIREARQSIWHLRSPRLEAHDLGSALREAATLAPAGGPRVSVEVVGAPLRRSPEADEQLLRIGREAITNAVRHAAAREVRASLAYGADGIVLVVADDGRGFEPDEGTEAGHFGLTTMRERAESVGGTLRVDARPGAGTTITATVPYR